MKGERVRRLFRLDRFGGRTEESVEDEVRFHIETREEQHRQAGMPPEEAAAEARRTFGDPHEVLDECRRIDDRWVKRRARMELIGDLTQDVRFAARGLARNRGFTVVALLSLAVGVGMNTAAFTAIDAIWFAPVPGVTGQDEIVELVTVDRGFERFRWTYPDFWAVRSTETPLASLAGWADMDLTLGAQEGGRRLRAAYATPDYFSVFGASPPLGRDFLASETAPGQHAVVIVSHDLWMEEFGGDPGVVGRSVTLNREPYTVIGVAPEGFRGPRFTLGSTHLWLPLAQHPHVVQNAEQLRDHSVFWLGVMGRLRPGATLEEVEPAVRTVFARTAEVDPNGQRERTVRAASFGRFPAQNRIWDMLAMGVLVALLVLVLLIICANLAGMAMARAAAREQETAVRLALGSGRVRLVRYLMVEALLLALVGGGVGIAVAVIVMGTVSPATFGIIAPGAGFEPSSTVLGTSVFLTLLAGVAFGLLPAVRSSRPELVSSLKDDTGGGGRRVGRMQRLAASAQVCVAVTGLALGGLFWRSLDSLDRSDLGFEPEGMVVTDYRTGALSSALLDLSAEGFGTLGEGGQELLHRLRSALGAVTGVTAVAFADGVPLDGRRRQTSVYRADLADEPGGRVVVEYTRVGEGYLDAIGATVVRGRGFRVGDDATSDPVVVVSESLAERFWPGEDPIGRSLSRRISDEERRTATVVGVMAELAPSRAGERWPQILIPMRQEYRARVMMVLRTSADLSSLVGPVRSTIRSVDPALPQPNLVSAPSIVERSTQEQAGAARIGGGLGLFVLLLSAIGVYGVVAMAVANRTAEIGLRMAVGASRERVLGQVLLDAVRLATPGMAVGAVLAAGTAAAMRSMLLGVSPLDPVPYLGAVGLLSAVVVLASVAPARRASAIHPVEALRRE